MVDLKCIRRWPLWLAAFLFCAPSIYAAKILYVQRDLQRDTVKFINILRAEGNEVTVVSDNTDTILTAPEYQAQGYDLLIVDEVISSGNVGDRFRNSPIPVINWEGYLYSGNRSAFNADSGLVGGNYADAATAAADNGGAGGDYGQVLNLTSINITDPSHPLAAGLPAGAVDVFDPTVASPPTDGAGVITFAGARTFIPGVDVVATVPGFNNGYCLFGVDAGVTNADGTTNLARWVHLPWNDTDPGRVIIQPSFFLFDAAVAWAQHLPQPTKIYDLLPVSNGFLSTNTPVTFAVDKTTAAGSAVAQSDIHLTVNGTDVIGDASITDSGTQWLVSYTSGFAPNKILTIVASATAADGGTSARMSSIDTFDQNNFTVEAENFNYGGGMFFDNPVLCTNIGGTTPGCYFDRVGYTNIDELELDFNVTVDVPLTNEVYRFGSGFIREEYVDTFLTDDPLVRQKYLDAGIPDYEVRNITSGEWLNYTRTYPTGTYNVYARISAPGAASIQMDAVDNATTTNQTLTKLGRFISNGTSGYALVPLTDDSGTTPIVVEFTNEAATTLRMTALSGGYVANFYMLVPTTAAVNQPPTTQITSLTNYTVVEAGTPMDLTASATDDGVVTNVAFYAINDGVTNLIGQVTAMPYTVSWIPASAEPLSYQTVEVVATDNGGLTAQDQVTVKVLNPDYHIITTADGNGADAELREDDGGDSANGTGSSMNVRITITTGNTNRHEVIGMRFDLGATDMSSIGSAALNLISYRALSARDIHAWGVPNGTTGLDNNGLTPGYTDNDWDEGAVVFSTMPGLVWDGQEETQGITNTAVDLGVLNESLGEGGIWTFDTPALTSFLQTNDDVVTILLAQDSDSTGQSRFATKEATQLTTSLATPAPAGWFAPYLSFVTTGPQLNYSMTPGGVQFNWTGNFKLQVQTNSLAAGIGSNWVDYPGGGSSPVTVPIAPDQGSVFFRLISNP